MRRIKNITPGPFTRLAGKFKFYTTIIIPVLALFIPDSGLRAKEILDLNNETAIKSQISLSPYIYFYEDKTGSLEFKDVLKKENEFKLNTMEFPVFGFTGSTIWGKVSIQADISGMEINKDWYLFFDYPLLENLDFYIEKSGNPNEYHKIETGTKIDSDYRNFYTPRVKIPVEFKPGKSKTIYLRMRNVADLIQVPLYLDSGNGLFNKTNAQSIFQGFYYGVLLVMFLYNFFIFFTVRDRSYLYYCVYVLSVTIVFTTIHGRLSLLFAPDFMLYRIVAIVTLATSGIFALLFARDFLQTKQNSPRLYKAMNVLIVLYIFYIFFSIMISHYGLRVYFLIMISGCFVLLASGLRLYRKYSYARYYTHAWALYLVLLIIYTLRPLKVHFPFPNYGLEIGGMIEAVLLSFALADRIRLLQKEQKQFGLVQRDLAMATEIQKYLFPRSRQRIPEMTGGDLSENPAGITVKEPVEISGKYLPSSSLSGDFYDYVKDDHGNLCILMVDVAGHGYAAGLVASMIKVAFHETLERSKSVLEHQIEINRILCNNVQNTFATALNVRIEPAKKEFSLVCSGHTPVFHFKKREDKLEEYRPGGIPLGITREYTCEQMTVEYEPGDRLVLFTDGLVEELNFSGEEYGINRLKGQIRKNKGVGPEKFADRLMADLVGWKEKCEQEDDITFVVIDLN